MKNKLIVGSLALLTIAVSSVALAQGNETGKANMGEGKEHGMGVTQMMVSIGPNGNAQLRGTLSSVSGKTLNITSWGGTWVVDVTNAKAMAKGGDASTGLSQFQTGDWINVLGTASTSTAWSVIAKKVRDESLVAKPVSAAGTISDLSGSSFTLSQKNGKTSKVTINADAKVWLNGASTTVSGLSNGLFAQVSGLWNRAGDTILASMVRARTMSTSAKSMERNSTSTREGGR